MEPGFMAFALEKAHASSESSALFYGGLGALIGLPIWGVTWLLERVTGPNFQLLSEKTSTAMHAILTAASWVLATWVMYKVPTIHGDALLMACGFGGVSATIYRRGTDGKLAKDARALAEAVVDTLPKKGGDGGP